MKSLKLSQTILVAILGALALAANAQTDSKASSHATPLAKSAKSAVTTTPEPRIHEKSVHATKHHAAKHTAMAHKTRHMTHKTVAAEEAGKSESAYHTALKQCVAGPAAHRDSCLDDAIVQFSRS